MVQPMDGHGIYAKSAGMKTKTGKLWHDATTTYGKLTKTMYCGMLYSNGMTTKSKQFRQRMQNEYIVVQSNYKYG